jgi:hypothetical protein
MKYNEWVIDKKNVVYYFVTDIPTNNPQMPTFGWVYDPKNSPSRTLVFTRFVDISGMECMRTQWPIVQQDTYSYKKMIKDIFGTSYEQ